MVRRNHSAIHARVGVGFRIVILVALKFISRPGRLVQELDRIDRLLPPAATDSQGLRVKQPMTKEEKKNEGSSDYESREL